MQPGLLAVVQKLWPRGDPVNVLTSNTFPQVIPSPAIADLEEDPEQAAMRFSLVTVPRECGEGEAIVHTSWHWAFRITKRRLNKITMGEMGASSVARIMFQRSPDLEFLSDQASTIPEWEHALRMGSEELTLLGYLGNHSLVYPVNIEDIIRLRNDLLSNDFSKCESDESDE